MERSPAPRRFGLTLEDEGRISQLVGFGTWRKGRRYATDGAVLEQAWDEGGTVGVGLVDGTGPEPYRVRVTVGRDDTGRITSLDTDCTCPVGWMCKHAVALLVAAASEDPGPGSRPGLTLVRAAGTPSAPPLPGPADWELRLQGVLGGSRPGADAEVGRMGLQFELTDHPTHGRRVASGGQGVRLRPVTPSTAGNWVRSGVAWTQLDGLRHGHVLSVRAGAQVELLRELRALSHLGPAGRWQGWGDDAVWLESIPSRRLWDVLRHCRELGIPLLRSGRDSGPVQLEATPVEAVTDLTRHPDGLHLRPQLLFAGDELAPAGTLLVGAPPHGLVWWDEPVRGDRTPPLRLAPFARTPDSATLELLAGRPLAVPAGDVDRFERDVVPVLRRRIALRSSDSSVTLPEVPNEPIGLQVTYRPGPSVDLVWALPGPDDAADDPAAEVVARATAVVAPIPGLVRETPFGARLVTPAQVQGMGAVLLVTDALPRLRALEGLAVEERGDAPNFSEATAAPVIRMAGDETASGDWLDLAVEVSVGDEVVPYAELFTALAEGRSHLLLPSGTWFSLERQDLRRLAELIAEARSLHDAPPGRARLSRYQASLWEDLSHLADDGVAALQAGAWRSAVEALAGTAADVADLPAPAGLEATLRPYQLDGFRWLVSRYEHRLGGILADDMGLGKTLQALALMVHASATGRPRWLVVAPTSVVGNWVSEARRFAPGLTSVAVTETAAKSGLPLARRIEGADVVVTSYTLFRLDHEAYGAETWAGALFDEAQFLKNPASHANQRARRLPAPFKLAMTGTPLENSLKELWALTTVTSPGLLARSERFDQTYRNPIERHGDGERLDQLRRRIRPVMLRRTKSQVAADLPDKQEQVLELDLHPKHRSAYDTYLHRERQKLLGLIDDMGAHRFEVLRSLTLLRQAALDVTLVDPTRTGIPSTKLDALVELLSEAAAEGHRALVFSQFTRYLTLARQRVEGAGIACCYLDGSTRNRPEVIERFRAGDAPVFLISLKAGGFGLNLTEADHCVLLDPWWNPATEAQAVDRVHRIGQQRKVNVYRMVSRGTIEEKVMSLKQRKSALFANVMDAGGFESVALSADDVRALLE